MTIKLNIQKTKIMESGPITSWQIEGGQEEAAAEESVAGVLKDLAHSSVSCSTGLEFMEECFYLVSLGFILREMKFSRKP